MSIDLLWADDDCNRFLSPLGRLLKRDPRFNLTKATNYLEALKLLESSHGAYNLSFHSLLIDIILPHDDGGRGALMSSSLGLTLANQAAIIGVKAIVFLTVVRRDEVADKFKDLQRNHQNTRFGYFDKTELLNGNELRKLFDALDPST